MPSDRSKAIARAIAESVGSRPPIHIFESDHFPEHRTAILFAEGWPRENVNVAVTLDLSDVRRALGERQYELYIAAHPGWNIEQVLGDVAVRVRRGAVVPEPGEYIDGGMHPSYPAGSVQHLAVLDPPLLELPLAIPEQSPPLGFLQLVPYTDEERRILESRGKLALEAALRLRGDALLDLGRA